MAHRLPPAGIRTTPTQVFRFYEVRDNPAATMVSTRDLGCRQQPKYQTCPVLRCCSKHSKPPACCDIFNPTKECAHVLPPAGMASKKSDVFRFHLVHPDPTSCRSPAEGCCCCCCCKCGRVTKPRCQKLECECPQPLVEVSCCCEMPCKCTCKRICQRREVKRSDECPQPLVEVSCCCEKPCKCTCKRICQRREVKRSDCIHKQKTRPSQPEPVVLCVKKQVVSETPSEECSPPRPQIMMCCSDTTNDDQCPAPADQLPDEFLFMAVRSSQ